MNPLADFPFRDHLTLQLTEKIQLQAKDVEMKKKGGGCSETKQPNDKGEEQIAEWKMYNNIFHKDELEERLDKRGRQEWGR